MVMAMRMVASGLVEGPLLISITKLLHRGGVCRYCWWLSLSTTASTSINVSPPPSIWWASPAPARLSPAYCRPLAGYSYEKYGFAQSYLIMGLLVFCTTFISIFLLRSGKSSADPLVSQPTLSESKRVKMMTYTISRAEQVLQTQRQALNLRWYPHYHLAARAGWINDPNGLVWFDGWYHAFYQHHPYSTQWGPMHWGHARSKDLVHWEHLPVALAPEGPEDKDGCFSGSAVVDGDTLALIYTGHKFHGDPGDEANLYQVQCLATSRDGIHFERQGMVVDTPPGMHHFRDPKVWREGDCWYMIVGAREGDTGQVRLYRSADLRQWQDAGVLDEAESTMGYMWECPDFFTLNGKRVLMFSPQGCRPRGSATAICSRAAI
ncbi:glycoside hydrolase family protein 32 [Klebsiella pneumoniae]|uniref:beta-fructofuranosidase n=1 Tax=Klebsiella pneumoniae TaxID=573 RepID=A0A4P0YFK1_KLEPN|nr:glycoside hydrolase family protein 32 [Klebsiella pneumoniae]